MKHLSFALALSLLLFSCSKEQTPETQPAEPDSSKDTVSMTVNLVVETENCKTVTEGLKVRFEVGDSLAVWDGVKLRCFTASDRNGTIVFSGEAVSTDCYWALYPWRSDCTVDASSGDPVFSASLPLNQSAVSASLPKGALVGIGKTSSAGKILLKSVCSYLKFSFPASTTNAGKPGTLNRISLTSTAGLKLGGAFGVSLDSAGEPVISSADRVDGDGTVTVLFDKELPQAGSSYMFSILPADLSAGVKMECFRSGDSATASISGGNSSSNNMERNVLKNMGDLRPRWVATQEETDDSSADPSGAFDYSLFSSVSHPRVLMCDEDFRILDNYIKDGSYPVLTSRHLKTIAHADDLIGKEIPTLEQIKTDYPAFLYQKNRHLSLLARYVLEHLAVCAYAYRTTGETKYLDECRRVADQVCADENWYPESFLSTGEITLGVAIAYDWLYYDLTLEERERYHSNLVSKGIQARKSSTLNEKNNRGEVYSAGLMAAALAVYEKDKSAASGLMEESYTKIPLIMDAVYGTKGSSFEGYGYWEYGTSFLTVYLECLQTMFGTTYGFDQQTGFDQTGTYMLFMADSLAPFGYCDGGAESVSSRSAMWWLACHFNRPEYLANELYRDNMGYGSNSRLMSLIPCCLAKYPKMELNSIPYPSQKLWVDDNNDIAPLVLARNGWNNSSSDKYLGIKGGKANVGHGHMDVGSFTYHAYGKVWSTDVAHKTYSNYTLQGLSGNSQTGTTWEALAYNSLGHSTISFGNYSGSVTKLHTTDHIVDGKATILESYDNTEELGGKLDLTPLFTGQVQSATRKVVIYKNSELRVEDHIKALDTEDAELIWRLVTPADPSVSGDVVTLTSGNQTVYLVTECTEGSVTDLVAHNWGIFSASRPSAGQWGWTREVTWDESHNANVAGFTMNIPKGTTVTILTKITPVAPGSSSSGFEGETPDFNNDKYEW